MKKLLFLMMVAFIASACEKDLYDEKADEKQLKKFVFTEDFEVPVKEGCITTVTYNGEVLYEGNVAVTIQVPKTDVSTRSDSGLEWHFTGAEGGNSTSYYYSIMKSGVLLFEDMTDGDNDYNDFVCRVEWQFAVNLNGAGNITTLELAKLGVYPLAMGNMLPLSFGFEVVNTANNTLIDDIVLYSDVRNEAFDGTKGFINTDKELPAFALGNRNYFPYGGHTGSSKTYKPSIRYTEFTYNFYIAVNGVKRYTADSSKALLTDSKTPFGIYIPNVQSFKYPIEKTSIYEAYPNFKKWLEGQNVAPFVGGVAGLLY